MTKGAEVDFFWVTLWLLIWLFIIIFKPFGDSNLVTFIFWCGLLVFPVLYSELHTKEKAREKYKADKSRFYRNKLIANATAEEIRFAHLLSKYNIEYTFQKEFYIDRKLYIVDFCLPKLRTCIEIDGIQHLRKKGRELDEMRENLIKQRYRMKFLRFNNFEINESNEDKIIEQINNEG